MGAHTFTSVNVLTWKAVMFGSIGILSWYDYLIRIVKKKREDDISWLESWIVKRQSESSLAAMKLSKVFYYFSRMMVKINLLSINHFIFLPPAERCIFLADFDRFAQSLHPHLYCKF